MRDLAALAEQIRTVREAEKQFMSLWRVEQVLVGPEVLDRLSSDMAEINAMAGELLDLCGESSNGAYGGTSGWSMNGEGGSPGI